MSRKRLTKLSRGHHLLNVFATSVAVSLIILSLLRVVLRYLDDKINLMLYYLIFWNFSS